MKRVDRGPLIAVDFEQTIKVRGAENLLDDGRHFAQAQLAASGVNPALEQDQLAEECARNQAHVREVDHQPDRAAVVRKRLGDLIGDFANRPLVEKLMILKTDNLDPFGIVDLNPGCSGHRRHPDMSCNQSIGSRLRTSVGLGRLNCRKFDFKQRESGAFGFFFSWQHSRSMLLATPSAPLTCLPGLATGVAVAPARSAAQAPAFLAEQTRALHPGDRRQSLEREPEASP
jgi:hypothetical protein